MHKVFKPAKKTDELKAAYLYADGHLITTFERRTDVGILPYCKIAEKITKPIRSANYDSEFRYSMKTPDFTGRLVFHHPLTLAACLSLPDVVVHIDFNNGSQATRRDGIHIDSVRFLSRSETILSINVLPQLSSGITIQPDAKPEVWADLAERYHWGDAEIVERFPVEKPKPEAETEAA